MSRSSTWDRCVGEAHSVGSLNGRAVGNGVGKGDAKLDDVGAALLHREEHIGSSLGRGETGRDVGDERGLRENSD